MKSHHTAAVQERYKFSGFLRVIPIKTMKASACFLIFCAPLFCANTTTIPITQERSAGTPLENIGRVIILDTQTDGSMLRARRDEWSVRNASQHQILAFVEVMRTHYSDGQIAERTVEHDAFFDTRMMNPGDVLDYSREPSATGTPIRKSEELSQTSSVVTTLWVQYSDGTTWGDATYAAQLFEINHSEKLN